MFQIVYSVVCYFDFFFDDFLFFFNAVCSFHKVVVLVHTFFKPLQTICKQRLCFAVAKICAGQCADKCQKCNNNGRYVKAHTIYLLY